VGYTTYPAIKNTFLGLSHCLPYNNPNDDSYVDVKKYATEVTFLPLICLS